MIEKLTKEQVSQLSAYRDKWLRIGLNTDPLDKEKAKNAVKLAYKWAGLKEPEYFIFLNDPLEGCIGACMLSNMDADQDQVRNQVGNKVKDQVWDQVADQIADQVVDRVANQIEFKVWSQIEAHVMDQISSGAWYQVKDQIGNQVRDQIWNPMWTWGQIWPHIRDQISSGVWSHVIYQVGHPVGDQVMDQIRDQIKTQIMDQVMDQDQIKKQLNKCGYGSHDSGWFSFYNYFLDICELDCCSKLNGLFDTAKYCGWWWPFDNYAIITPKPCKIYRDENNRLHNESTAALEYKYGMKIYAWHGTIVPKEWIIDRGNIDISDCFTWENIEQRRCLCEIIGWDKVIEKSECKIIHDDEYGKLLVDDKTEKAFLLMMGYILDRFKVHYTCYDCKYRDENFCNFVFHKTAGCDVALKIDKYYGGCENWESSHHGTGEE